MRIHSHPTRPELSVLLEDISSLGYKGAGRKYGVSDNAIRKWVKILSHR
jgi:transposase-like protein